VAWVAEENLHVTVKFIGSTDETRVEAVLQALRASTATARAFEVTIRGLGAFPTPSRPRVLWAGLEPAEPLAALAAEVDRAVAALGVPPEARPFAAHVTLGRVRALRRNPRLADALARPAELGALPVRGVSLMRSELSPRGARYTELATVLLAGDAGPVE
jgi:2'-5' RNA ligase